MFRPVTLLQLVLLTSCTSGEASLELKATPRTLDGQGQVAELRVVATDARGNAGRGRVTLASSVGTLTDTTLTLDSLGTASTSFGCVTSAEPACQGVLEVDASWTADDVKVNGRVSLTIVPPIDAGVGTEVRGPLAFPAGSVFADRLSSSTVATEVGFIVSRSSNCALDPTQSRTFVTLRFFDNAGLGVGTYSTRRAAGSGDSLVSYGQLEPLPDGGVLAIEQAFAESGNAQLTRFDPGDAGLSSVRAAGTFDVMVRLRDGGQAPLIGTFATNCP